MMAVRLGAEGLDPEVRGQARGETRFRLLRYYVATSLLVTAVVTVAMAFSILSRAQHNFEARSTFSSSQEALRFSQIFYETMWLPALQRDPGSTLRDAIDPVALEQFARRITFGFDIFRIGILDLYGTVLWSNDPAIVGLGMQEPSLSAAVLAEGGPRFQLSRGTMPVGGTGDQMDVDVVTTYAPIKDHSLDAPLEGETIGLMRIDADVTSDMEAARRDSLQFAMTSAFGMGAVLFTLLFLIVYRGDKTIISGQNRIIRQREDLNAAQARYGGILEIAQSAVISVDETHKITMFNRGAARIFGYSAEEAVGQPLDMLLPDRFREDHRRCLDQFGGSSVSSRGMNERAEVTGLRKGGTEFPAEAGISHLTLGDEKIFTVMPDDITERKRAEEGVRQASRLASVGELAAGLAHEINNPLTSILGFSELLTTEKLPEPVLEDLRRISSEAQRAARVVQNLLSFSRSNDGEKEYVDVKEVAQKAIELKAHELRSNNVDLTTEFSEGVPHTMADPNQLVQVMLNLLTNAEQALTEAGGGGRVAIRTSLHGDRIRISVADDGPGIAPEDIGKVFDPFYTTKEVGKGTGLGLSICYGIVAQHRGELSVESELGKRTTFHIELPVTGAVEDRPEPIAQPAQATASRQHILVVDDEAPIRDLLARELRSEGHDVDLARDGDEGWSRIQATSYDHILLDMKMPGLSGQQLYDLAKESGTTLAGKVIFITGDTLAAETRTFIVATGSTLLNKPFHLDELRRAIRGAGEEETDG